jgi:predicted Zn-dependent peptidase
MTQFVHVPSDIGLDLLGFYYALGSDFEVEGSYGTNHVMEHLICKSFDDLLPKMKRLGIDYDASTGPDRMSFYFGGLSENLAILAQELYDRITQGSFTWNREAFETERKTVIQEYDDSYNNQLHGAYQNWMRKHYNYFGPIGKREDILSLTYEESLQRREDFHRPILVCQVGKQTIQPDIQQKEVVFVPTAKRFGSYKTPLEKTPKGQDIVGLLSNNTIPKSDINRVGLVLSCLNNGIESPLVQEIRDKRGLSYGSFGWIYDIMGSGVMILCAETSKKNKKALREVYREFFSGDLTRHLSRERFNDCWNEQRWARLKGERLPHMGAITTILQNNPYEGLEDFTYEKALRLLTQYFGPKSFKEVVG